MDDNEQQQAPEEFERTFFGTERGDSSRCEEVAEVADILPGDENREEFDGRGWLIAFSDLPRKYAGIRDFYAENYRVPFCSHDPSPQLEAYLEAERERTGKRDCVEGYLLIEGE
jgi:hypothetical protein